MKVAEITTLLSIWCTGRSHAPPQLAPCRAVHLVPGGPTLPLLRRTRIPRHGAAAGRAMGQAPEMPVQNALCFFYPPPSVGMHESRPLFEQFQRQEFDTSCAVRPAFCLMVSYSWACICSPPERGPSPRGICTLRTPLIVAAPRPSRRRSPALSEDSSACAGALALLQQSST